MGGSSSKAGEAVRSDNAADLEAALRESPASLLEADRNGQTLVHHAAIKKSNKCLRLLVRELQRQGRQAVVSRPDNRGWFSGELTPMHYAARADSSEAILILRNAGAALNPRCQSSWTPLHWAAYEGRSNAAQTLLSLDPSLSSERTADGKTALLIAVKENQPETLSILLLRSNVAVKQEAFEESAFKKQSLRLVQVFLRAEALDAPMVSSVFVKRASDLLRAAMVKMRAASASVTDAEEELRAADRAASRARISGMPLPSQDVGNAHAIKLRHAKMELAECQTRVDYFTELLAELTAYVTAHAQRQQAPPPAAQAAPAAAQGAAPAARGGGDDAAPAGFWAWLSSAFSDTSSSSSSSATSSTSGSSSSSNSNGSSSGNSSGSNAGAAARPAPSAPPAVPAPPSAPAASAPPATPPSSSSSSSAGAAAACASAAGSGDAGDGDGKSCVICLEPLSGSKMAFVPCGHVCCCEADAGTIMRTSYSNGGPKCPICRTPIQQAIKLFF